MMDKWKIIEKDAKAREEHRICCYCKRFFCTEYHHPRNRMVCSGILPQWDCLHRLMRDVKAMDTCKKFEMHQAYKDKLNQRGA